MAYAKGLIPVNSAANNSISQQTVMNLDLHTNTVSQINLLASGNVAVETGIGEKPRVMYDDRGRVWVSGRFSTVNGSDYFTPAILDVSNTTLDYGWMSNDEWNGGTSVRGVVGKLQLLVIVVLSLSSYSFLILY